MLLFLVTYLLILLWLTILYQFTATELIGLSKTKKTVDILNDLLKHVFNRVLLRLYVFTDSESQHESCQPYHTANVANDLILPPKQIHAPFHHVCVGNTSPLLLAYVTPVHIPARKQTHVLSLIHHTCMVIASPIRLANLKPIVARPYTTPQTNRNTESSHLYRPYHP